MPPLHRTYNSQPADRVLLGCNEEGIASTFRFKVGDAHFTPEDGSMFLRNVRNQQREQATSKPDDH
jgi:hypothetical protein